MQLYALNSEKKLIFSNHANRQQDYYCIECQQIIRLRGGPHRQNHYYHLATTSNCRQNGKSMAHLQAQLYILNKIGQDEIELEVRFPEINRIADVVWKKSKIIFEIQCSPITSLEVQQRNTHYKSIGYQVVWILNDNPFNKWRVTAAEHVLQDSPFYYTNINADGEGCIYDQFAFRDQGIRKKGLSPLPIDVNDILYLPKALNERTIIPEFVKQRMKHWPLFFKGDLVYLSHHASDDLLVKDYLEEALAIEAEFTKKDITEETTLKTLLWKFIVRPYKLLFQIILERACK